MVEYADQNLAWLKAKKPDLEGSAALGVGDATNYRWTGRIDAVASETYLGRPLSSLPAPDKLKAIVSDVNTILVKSLRNLAGQLKSGTPLCLAVPAWQTSPERFKSLPLLDKLTDMGYSMVKFKHVGPEQLIYYRPNQVVGRELIVLERL
jgi:hypothetical protein